jgi:hypothetical protein
MAFESDRDAGGAQPRAAGGPQSGENVSIWSVGDGRHRVEAPNGEHVVEGHDAAIELAHQLAGDAIKDATRTRPALIAESRRLFATPSFGLTPTRS